MAARTAGPAKPLARAVTQDIPSAGWSGGYAGIHGGAFGQQSTTYDLDQFNTFAIGFGPGGTVSQARTGGLVGAHIGHNWQSRNLVYGLEADFTGLFASNDQLSFGTNTGAPFAWRYSSEMKWMSTARVRAGLDVNGTLAYATAGLAVAGIRNRWGLGFTDGINDPPFAFQFSDDSTRLGWTAGGGIEHRFSPGWSARLEGLYADFGRSKTATFPLVQPTQTTNLRTQWDNSAILVRGGLTHHWQSAP